MQSVSPLPRCMVYLFILAMLYFGSAHATSETRIALVIGNGDYSFSPLKNPPSDARLVADALRATGFEVIQLNDATQQQMKTAVRDFSQRLKDARDTVALFYYAGHGVQLEERNFLIPTDADIQTQADVEFASVDAQWVLDVIKESHSGLSVVVLDACRNNPFASATRSGTRGLARMDAPRGSILAYSTSPGNEALDGIGDNSPYSQALANAIAQPGLKLEDVFKQVRREVLQSTANKQVPWESSSLTGDFYFMPPGEKQTVAKLNPPESTPVPTQDRFNAGDIIRDCEYCPKLAVLPAGSAQIGSNKGETGAKAHESSAFVATFNSFAISVTEVTRDQFREFVESSGYAPADGCWDFKGHFWNYDKKRNWANPGFVQTGNHPVVCVNWNDANAYTEWLSDQTGQTYRLPSEAEWEYAARGGSKEVFSWGAQLQHACEYANLYDVTASKTGQNKWAKAFDCDDGALRTQPVASHQSNGFGLYDTIGNVNEWVADCWFDQHDEKNSSGAVRRGGRCTQRVLKGSHYLHDKKEDARPAHRQGDEPVDRTTYYGFRVLRER